MELSTLISTCVPFAALLAVAATMYTARKQRAAELQIAAHQIESSFRILSEQLNSQSKLAFSQISAARAQALDEIKAQVLTKNRQEWINDLRNTLAHFIVSTHKCRNNLIISPEKRDPDRIHANVDEAWLHLTRLRLLINPNEDDHKDLLTTANLMFELIKPNEHGIQLKDVEQSLLIKGQGILKREWERVKSLA
jgi:endonuclease/exonuclease/phosphatase (EEP) superfamily protein YafD